MTVPLAGPKSKGMYYKGIQIRYLACHVRLRVSWNILGVPRPGLCSATAEGLISSTTNFAAARLKKRMSDFQRRT